jgi:hypothetical protein
MKLQKFIKYIYALSIFELITPQNIPIIIVSTLVDIASLYIMFNDVLTQSRWFLYILVGSIGFLLALMPILWVHIYKQRQYRMQQIPFALLIVMPAVFSVLIAVIFWLRLETRNLEVDAGAMSMIIGGQIVQPETAMSPAATPMAVLLCAVPLVTAVINLFMAWIFDNPILVKIKKPELAKITLAADIAEQEAKCAEYDAEDAYKQRMLKEEDAKYAATHAAIEATANFYKAYARERIAEHLKDPASTSALSQLL